jgi:hypothetical protein
VRCRHHLDPLRRRQLALGEHPSDLVVEDLGGSAGDGAQPASRSSVGHSLIETSVFAAADTISMGENACGI